MNRSRVLFAAGVVLSGVAMLDASPPEPPAPGQDAVTRAAPCLLDFPGGSCESFTRALTTMFPEKSVVLAPGVAGFELPPMRVSLGSIVPGLKLACGIEGELVYPEQSGLRVRGTLELERISNDIVRLMARPTAVPDGRTGRAPTRGEDARSLLVHPLGSPVLSRLSIDEVRTAIDLTFELIDQAPPTIRFHESTGIFFVYGTDEQNEGFRETLDALSGVAVLRSRRGDDSVGEVDPAVAESRERHRREAQRRIDEIRDRVNRD